MKVGRGGCQVFDAFKNCSWPCTFCPNVGRPGPDPAQGPGPGPGPAPKKDLWWEPRPIFAPLLAALLPGEPSVLAGSPGVRASCPALSGRLPPFRPPEMPQAARRRCPLAPTLRRFLFLPPVFLRRLPPHFYRGSRLPFRLLPWRGPKSLNRFPRPKGTRNI